MQKIHSIDIYHKNKEKIVFSETCRPNPATNQQKTTKSQKERKFNN